MLICRHWKLAGMMAQGWRALASLVPEDLSLVHSTHKKPLIITVTLVPGDLTPSSGLCKNTPHSSEW